MQKQTHAHMHKQNNKNCLDLWLVVMCMVGLSCLFGEQSTPSLGSWMEKFVLPGKAISMYVDMYSLYIHPYIM